MNQICFWIMVCLNIIFDIDLWLLALPFILILTVIEALAKLSALIL